MTTSKGTSTKFVDSAPSDFSEDASRTSALGVTPAIAYANMSDSILSI